jgi:hypothetical protein
MPPVVVPEVLSLLVLLPPVVVPCVVPLVEALEPSVELDTPVVPPLVALLDPVVVVPGPVVVPPSVLEASAPLVAVAPAPVVVPPPAPPAKASPVPTSWEHPGATRAIVVNQPMAMGRVLFSIRFGRRRRNRPLPGLSGGSGRTLM